MAVYVHSVDINEGNRGFWDEPMNTAMRLSLVLVLSDEHAQRVHSLILGGYAGDFRRFEALLTRALLDDAPLNPPALDASPLPSPDRRIVV